MTTSSPPSAADAPLSLICSSRTKMAPESPNIVSTISNHSSPAVSPKPNLQNGGLPQPIPLSTSTPQTKQCCQHAAEAGQPFCPTCYVTAILSTYKQAQQLQQPKQEEKQLANSSNSDNGATSSSSGSPDRHSPGTNNAAPALNMGSADMLALLQQAALKQRLASMAPLETSTPNPPPLAAPPAPPTQEIIIQQILAQQAQQQSAAFDGAFGRHPMPPPPFFALGHPGAENGAGMMNPYGPFGGAFDINGMRRKNATRETTAVLKQWLAGHRKNPYPTKGEKIMLAIISKMTLTQVSTWFANARRRLKKENKGNCTWNTAGSGDDGNEGGSGSNDGDMLDDDLQIDGDSDVDLPDDDGDDAEPPQRRARFDQPGDQQQPTAPMMAPNPHQQALATLMALQQQQQQQQQQVPQQPNPVLAASIAALIEQQQQQQQQQQQPAIPQTPANPLANLLQTILLQQQMAQNSRPNVQTSNNPNPALILQQLQQQHQQQQKTSKSSPGGIWSIAAEIQGSQGQH